MEYKIIDKRGKERVSEVCRVCGSKEVHSRDYNNPTMKCIEYYRILIRDFRTEISELRNEVTIAREIS